MNAGSNNVIGKKTVVADRDGLKSLLEWSEKWINAQGLPTETAYKLRLIVEEVAANTVFHGFPDGAAGEIQCSIELADEGQSSVRIEDNGMAFNPLEQAPEPDLDADLDERDIGGMGVFLVLHSADEVNYERKDRRNILTIVL